MVFLTESWFWRGTQSAIFYYASCTPWVEYKHKRKRRKDATRARKEKEGNVIYAQPGVVNQPAPFQTNETWATEIVAGPGPPKGWKKDALYYKHAGSMKLKPLISLGPRARTETTTSAESHAQSEITSTTNASTAFTTSEVTRNVQDVARIHTTPQGESHQAVRYIPEGERQGPAPPSHAEVLTISASSPDMSVTAVESRPSASRELCLSYSRNSGSTGSKRSSFDSSSSSLASEEKNQRPPRPSMEKRLSSAMDGLKDAMRGALHPEHWNWIRYDRDDEVLSNLNEKMKGMWDSMKEHVYTPNEDATLKLKQVETKKSMAENEVKKWQRGTHPAINDLHPPIVSQMPYTREEAKWMLLPPASADVMMGRSRPDPFNDMNRLPLCIVGKPLAEKRHSSNAQMYLASSDEEVAYSSESEDGDWVAGWTHLQKPQRAYLLKNRPFAAS